MSSERHLCKNDLWWSARSSFFLSLVFLFMTVERSSLNNRACGRWRQPSSTFDNSTVMSTGISNLTIGSTLTVGIAFEPACEREGGDQESPAICFLPLPPFGDAIPSVPVVSLVEGLTAPSSSGEDSQMISAYVKILSISSSSRLIIVSNGKR